MSLYEEVFEPILTTHNPDPAKQVVFSIIRDMESRSGLQNALEDCDDEIKEEFIQKWIDLVRESLPCDTVQLLESCQSLLEEISAAEVDDGEELLTAFACEGEEFGKAIGLVLKGFGQVEE